MQKHKTTYNEVDPVNMKKGHVMSSVPALLLMSVFLKVLVYYTSFLSFLAVVVTMYFNNSYNLLVFSVSCQVGSDRQHIFCVCLHVL